ncbi:MAG: hypothetical protein ACYC7L_02120 [Nitrospirota bacterium]
MSRLRVFLTFALFVLIAVSSRESQAVIYKYVNEKGTPVFFDDLQKVPEQLRPQVVVVSGGNDYDAYAEQEKMRIAAEERRQQKSQAAAAVPAKTEELVTARLLRSGIAVALFIALLFVVTHIDAIREQAHLLSRARIALAVLLFAFIGYTHSRDVMGLFGTVGMSVANPVADIQERSAARGKKAAEAYKSMEKIIEQRAQDEEARLKEIEKKFEEAEQGK